jgi:hypothetical protein
MEPMIPFEFVCNGMKYTLIIEHEGHVWRLNHAKGRRMLAASIVCELVNHPERITRRPRLTEEQMAQLKALVTLGYGWIVKDLEGLPYACASKPKKERDDWRGGGAFIDLYPFMPTNCLMDLPDWSDPEPLDIVQTLRDAGVEVEG